MRPRAFVTFEPRVLGSELLRIARDPSWQTVFPVVDIAGRMIGMITQDELRILVSDPELLPLATASDLMRPAVTITARDSLRRALEKMRAERVRELPVVDDESHVIGFIDEGALAHFYLATAPAPASSRQL